MQKQHCKIADILARMPMVGAYGRCAAPFIFRVVFVVLFTTLFWALFSPIAAFAEYSNPSVTSVAQVRTDGSLHVAERRSFAFDESYSVLTWKIAGLPSDAEVTIESVRLSYLDAEGNITMDWKTLGQVNFEPDWREIIEQTDGKADAIMAFESSARRQDSEAYVSKFPSAGHFAFDRRNDRVYLFVDPTPGLTVVECDYLASEAVLAFDDVAELYWDYVEAKDDIETGSVRTQIQLPVPEGATVAPGENVMAWGHGPAGSLSINEDGTINFEVNDVRAGQYAQAHIIFPVKWLSNITLQQRFANNGLRSDAARAEEAAWIDSYSAGLINSDVISMIYCAICMLLLIVGVGLYMLFGRAYQAGEMSPVDAARFIDTYGFAVAGRCARWNYWSPQDFALAIKTLIKRGAVTVNDADARCSIESDTRYAIGSDVRYDTDTDAHCGIGGDAHYDIGSDTRCGSGGDMRCNIERDDETIRLGATRLRMAHGIKDIALSKIEQDALHIIFSKVGMDYQSVSVSDIMQWLGRHQDEAQSVFHAWQEQLDREVAKAGIFDKKSYKASKYMWVACAVLLVWAIWLLVSGGAVWQTILFAATGAVIGCIAYNIPRRTQAGAQLEAAVLQDGEALGLSPWQKAIVDAVEEVVLADGSGPSKDSKGLKGYKGSKGKS